MTRILVCGLADEDFVHKSLDEINLVYGPVSCVIHNNHTQALAWQQDVSEIQVTRHLPVVEDWRKDGVLAPTRCRDRMFAAKPDYLVVFRTVDKDGNDELFSDKGTEKTKLTVYRAQKDGIEVLTFTDVVRVKRRRRPEPEQVATV
jgi:hypothetical protein